MREVHPYGTFIPPQATSLIVGSFPIGKFTNPLRKHEIKDHELDFFFGGETNLLWRLLGDVFQRPLTNTKGVKKFLREFHIGIGDVIQSCERKDGSASDSALQNIMWNEDLLSHIQKYPVTTLYFTSKKVESWFLKLFPLHGYKTVVLISPSAQSFRSLPHHPLYASWKKRHPKASAYEFILNDYKAKWRFVNDGAATLR